MILPGISQVEWNNHLTSFLWSIAFLIFGLSVLAFDTQKLNNPRKTKMYVRDRILGLEQRHFVVVLNSVLLYISLAFFA